MPTSTTPAIERIARVLAGRQLSLNGEGSDPHASGAVDASWQKHVDDAYAILHTLREPDEQMAQAGDVAVWRKMIGAVLERRP
ncbi:MULTISPECIES: hypothetical protein [Sphingobium]|jgi:hypothetical protein|uniref:Uncharacterized protein n=1 Tax=Sphingobium tyrosinilyticum TaxID=2715436 RepID=A0ABV9F5M8_9SPHN|nr:hypothetical protein [Sphingobium sp. EP60837]ANI78654.1 hypothetical protein EP837_02251 [Sphingobium sp. EP60837]